jgi:hypothetical protein
VVGDRLVDNFLPTVISGDFGLQRHMWRNENARKILRRLERGPLWSGMQDTMANQIKKPSLKQLVQLLWINIKMNRKSRPSMASIPISPASVISTIVASTEKNSSCSNNLTVMKFLINHT